MKKTQIYYNSIKHPVSILLCLMIIFFISAKLITAAMILIFSELMFVYRLANSPYYKGFLEYKKEKAVEEIEDFVLKDLKYDVKIKINNMKSISEDIFIFLTKTDKKPIFIDEQRKNMDKIINKYTLLQRTSAEYKKILENDKNDEKKIDFDIYYLNRKLNEPESNIDDVEKKMILENIAILEQKKESKKKLNSVLNKIELQIKMTEDIFSLASDKIMYNASIDIVVHDMDKLINDVDDIENIISKTKKEMLHFEIDT